MRVRRRKYKSGGVSWQADLGMIDGRRVMRSFATRQGAEDCIRAHRAQREELGRGGRLSPEELREASAAWELVRGVGAFSLVEVVRAGIAGGSGFVAAGGGGVGAGFGRSRAVGVSWAELVRAVIDSREREGCRQRYLERLKSVGGLFARAGFEVRDVGLISRADIEGWLDEMGVAARTRNGYLGDMRMFFRWAVKEGVLAMSPAEGIARTRLDEGEVGFLSVPGCACVLAVARREWGGSMLGMVVLGLFAGLRRAECERLKWGDVRLEDGVVVVSGAAAKGRSRRVVELEPAARAWLQVCARGEASQGLRPPGAMGRWVRLHEMVSAAGHAWPANGLRHSFATYHSAMFGDWARLQSILGHKDAGTLHRHYRGLATNAEAERFWALRS